MSTKTLRSASVIGALLLSLDALLNTAARADEEGDSFRLKEPLTYVGKGIKGRQALLFRAANTDEDESLVDSDKYVLLDSPVLSPCGERIAFAASTDLLLHGLSIYTMQRNGRDMKKAVEGSLRESLLTPSWSPDGKSIAFSSYDFPTSKWRIGIEDLESKKRQYVADGAFPTWSPDGNKLAFVGISKDKSIAFTHLCIIDLSTTKINVIHKGLIFSPLWAPEGDEIVFVAQKQDSVHRLAVINQNGEGLRWLGDHPDVPMQWTRDGEYILVTRAVEGAKEWPIYAVSRTRPDEGLIVKEASAHARGAEATVTIFILAINYSSRTARPSD